MPEQFQPSESSREPQLSVAMVEAIDEASLIVLDAERHLPQSLSEALSAHDAEQARIAQTTTTHKEPAKGLLRSMAELAWEHRHELQPSYLDNDSRILRMAAGLVASRILYKMLRNNHDR